MVLRDHKQRVTESDVVPQKGSHPYARKILRDNIQQLSYQRIIPKSDGGPAIADLKRVVQADLATEMLMTFEESPVDEPQANGVVERVVQSVVGQARTVLDALQDA